MKVPGYGDDEVMFIARTLRRVKPTHIFEWGTNRGSSARIFYEATQRYEIACEIHSTELPDELGLLDRDYPGAEVGRFVEGLPVQLHRGDGAMVSALLCRQAKAEHPLFFLDGWHLWENVYRELLVIERLASAAAILLHDTRSGPGAALARFLDEQATREHGLRYEVEHLHSQAGMARLLPEERSTDIPSA